MEPYDEGGGCQKAKKISLSAFDSYDCFITISQEGLIMKDTRI